MVRTFLLKDKMSCKHVNNSYFYLLELSLELIYPFTSVAFV